MPEDRIREIGARPNKPPQLAEDEGGHLIRPRHTSTGLFQGWGPKL